MGGCKTKALLITYQPLKTNGRDKMNQLVVEAKPHNSCQVRENEQALPSAGIHATVEGRKKARESRAAITFVSTSDWLNNCMFTLICQRTWRKFQKDSKPEQSQNPCRNTISIDWFQF